MRPTVFLTRRVPGRVRTELEASFHLRAHDSESPPSREELLRGAAGCAGLLTTLSDRVDGELFDVAGPGLRVVANYAVGTDNVDVGEAARRGVVVANTPDVLTEATAELTIALMLALARRVAEGDRLVRSGRTWVWSPTFMLSPGLRGRTLGIVGLGRIGREVARLGRAHGMEVIYASRREHPGAEAERVELRELLARADVVSLHLPLTSASTHLLGREELRAMRPTALLVNTARGPLIDEAALVEALEHGQIAGAALDVFEREPELEAGLADLPNVVLTPHLGSATEDAREGMGMLCVEALRAVLLEGREPRNVVRPGDGDG